MAAIAFDTLKCARRLIAAGYTDKQAEVQAEIMAEAFVFNVGALVTRDYLDARFAEQEARIDVKFEGIKGQFRLVYWMLAVSIASTVIPAIQQLYSLI